LREIPLLPTGGVTLQNAGDFIAAGAWGLGIGSALVDAKIVAEERFDELRERAAGFAAAAASARGQS
jgi:2-dehydro-3-deoxyphosphogluconate aldolase/(4S)-4-hydroxy-2-oxoglutarate aldolase